MKLIPFQSQNVLIIRCLLFLGHKGDELQ